MTEKIQMLGVERGIFLAIENEFQIYAHPSIYQPKERQMKIYFSEPEKGVDKDTGILLLIPGFGASTQSNVYKKMRNEFADNYNLLTLQCDYFGWQYMQNSQFNKEINFEKHHLINVFTNDELESIFTGSVLNIDKFINVCSTYKLQFICKANLEETFSDLNDMGIMQAIDNITAVLALISILNDNKLELNKQKIIIYGYSHGAYLSYLCNAFAPSLFSMIIDNSAWLFPTYLTRNRFVEYTVGKAIIRVEFEYLAKQLSFDDEMLSLPFLYKQFNNNCNIICFHGTTDCFVSSEKKEYFLKYINKTYFNKISKETVDELFKSTDHGLNVDFLKFLDYIFQKYPKEMLNKDMNPDNIQLQSVNFKTLNNKLEIHYDSGMPEIKF